MVHIEKLFRKISIFFFSFLFIFISFGCDKFLNDDILIVGIISHMPASNPAAVAFEAGLKDFGYFKGRNLEIIYQEISDASQDNVNDIIYNFVENDIDLLLLFEHDITTNCKPLTEKLGLPVIVISNPDPVASGFVKSLSFPGGNITGVWMPETAYKTMEWISIATPHARKIYLPYNPASNTSTVDLDKLVNVADELGLRLVVDEVNSAEEAAAAIEGLKGDIDAVFMLPSRVLNPESSRITRTAIELGLPTFASLLLDENVLLTFTGDFSVAGKQVARLAHEIYSGTSPSELPMEMSEAFLTINLKTAEKVGVTVPQGVLALAQSIVR